MLQRLDKIKILITSQNTNYLNQGEEPYFKPLIISFWETEITRQSFMWSFASSQKGELYISWAMYTFCNTKVTVQQESFLLNNKLYWCLSDTRVTQCEIIWLNKKKLLIIKKLRVECCTRHEKKNSKQLISRQIKCYKTFSRRLEIQKLREKQTALKCYYYYFISELMFFERTQI